MSLPSVSRYGSWVKRRVAIAIALIGARSGIALALCPTHRPIAFVFSATCREEFQSDLRRRIYAAEHCRGPANASLRVLVACGADGTSVRLGTQLRYVPRVLVRPQPSGTLTQRELLANVGQVREAVIHVLELRPRAHQGAHLPTRRRPAGPAIVAVPFPATPTVEDAAAVAAERPVGQVAPLLVWRSTPPSVGTARRRDVASSTWEFRMGPVGRYVIGHTTNELDVPAGGVEISWSYLQAGSLGFTVDGIVAEGGVRTDGRNLFLGTMIDAGLTVDLAFASDRVTGRLGAGLRGGGVVADVPSSSTPASLKGWMGAMATGTFVALLTHRLAFWTRVEVGVVVAADRPTQIAPSGPEFGMAGADAWVSASSGIAWRYMQ